MLKVYGKISFKFEKKKSYFHYFWIIPRSPLVSKAATRARASPTYKSSQLAAKNGTDISFRNQIL